MAIDITIPQIVGTNEAIAMESWETHSSSMRDALVKHLKTLKIVKYLMIFPSGLFCPYGDVG